MKFWKPKGQAYGPVIHAATIEKAMEEAKQEVEQVEPTRDIWAIVDSHGKVVRTFLYSTEDAAQEECVIAADKVKGYHAVPARIVMR